MRGGVRSGGAWNCRSTFSRSRPALARSSPLREARYAALAQSATRYGCNVVATAHHAEDQSETVLLALLRGAGPDGLRGMRARRPLADGVDLARPLLGLPSETLREYCHAHVLPYAVDPSNAEPAQRRNAVREALDALRPLFPALDAAVARAAQLISEDRERPRGPTCGARSATAWPAKSNCGTLISNTSRRRFERSKGGGPVPST